MVKSKCKLWTGKVYSNGYGRLGTKLAHRLKYEEAYGAIPKGLVIDHMCRNRLCVNPKHLRAVTREVNCTENSLSPIALNGAKTHCKYGHEFTERNTYIHRRKNRNQNRDCRTCTLELNRRWRIKNNA